MTTRRQRRRAHDDGPHHPRSPPKRTPVDATPVHGRFAPHGRNQLDHPSLALPLPNGDIVCNDDYNHRVIVVNPHSHQIVWQYGHTGVPSHKPGYLDNPDGLDLVPPNSLIDRRLKAR